MRALAIALVLAAVADVSAGTPDWSQYIEKGTPTYSQLNAPPRTPGIEAPAKSAAVATQKTKPAAATKAVAKPKTKARATKTATTKRAKH